MTLTDIFAARARICAELPLSVEWVISEVPCILDFSRARRDLQTGTDIPLVGGEPDPSWYDLLLFGEERHDGGAAPFYALHRRTSEVHVLDVESDTVHTRFVNSGVSHFVASVRELDRAIRLGEVEPATLAPVLQAIDPHGYPRSRWRGLIAALAERDDHR